jgi:hypothetical protein
MAEGRMLKKKISLNEAVADLADDTQRLLFTWGIAHLDVAGRITGSSRSFKALVVPLLDHITSEKVLDFFHDAESLGLIQRYEVDGEWHVQYPKFRANQKLTECREAASKRPAPPKSCQELSEDSVSNQRELDEDSLRTQPEVKLNEVNSSEGKIDVAPEGRKSKGRDFVKEFDEIFYPAYPNKKKPGHARDCYLRKGKKGELPPVAELVAVLEDQKTWPEWTKENGKYIDHPATWINGEGWKNQRPEVGRFAAAGGRYDKRPDHSVIEND